jgi:hypothetical protein
MGDSTNRIAATPPPKSQLIEAFLRVFRSAQGAHHRGDFCARSSRDCNVIATAANSGGAWTVAGRSMEVNRYR